MKWTPIQKAKGLEFGKEVFLKDETTSKFYIGRLIKEEKTQSGTVKTFEVAGFDPLAKADIRQDFTHVAKPK